MILCLMPLAYSSNVWDRPQSINNTMNVTIYYNITQNITNNIYYNLTNNITITNNITNNITETNNYYYLYNDTALWSAIFVMNQSLYANIDYLNISLMNESAERIFHDGILYDLLNTKLNQSQTDALYYPLSNPSGYINHTLLPTGKYLFNDSTYFMVNESALNHTINNISKIYALKTNISCYVTSGLCQNTSSKNISYAITEIRVDSLTASNKFYYELTESGNIIDRNRIKHTGSWDIEKNYGINNAVLVNISGATIDELIMTEITYLTNGVE